MAVTRADMLEGLFIAAAVFIVVVVVALLIVFISIRFPTGDLQ
jgi:type IV secretory pathway VirB3-like protein